MSKILIAEDDATLRSLIVRALGEDGHALTATADGAQAKRAHQMPRSNGFCFGQPILRARRGKWRETNLGHHESTETYLAIGRFIFEFSQLEYSLKHYIAHAVKLEDRFIDPIMTHDFAVLCTAANEVLGQSMNKDKRQNLNDIINTCRSINDDRVRIAHGLGCLFERAG